MWCLCFLWLIQIAFATWTGLVAGSGLEQGCPKDWDEQGGYCYQVYKSNDKREMKTQREARDHCRAQGADLPSVHNQTELQTIKKKLGWNQNAWIGLYSNNNGNADTWTDGTPFDYHSWASGQPKNHNGQENCVRHKYMYHGGQWEQVNCFLRLNWFCKIKKGAPWVPPTTPRPTAFPDKHCGMDKEWVYFKGECYFVEPNDKKNWYGARGKCMAAGGDLASINDGEINGLLTSMAYKHGPDIYWIGLNYLDREQYRWCDGTRASFINWAKGEPNDHHFGQLCVNLWTINGAWRDDNCGDPFPYICKKRNGTLTPKTIPATSPLPGYCPSGYYGIGNKCFRTYGFDESERFDFDKAVKQCRSQGSWFDLASINSAAEQAVVTAVIGGTTNFNFWIGLTNRVESRLQWIDNSPLMFINWDRGQPNGISRCTNVQGRRNKFGKWALTLCNTKNGYICEYYKKSDRLIPTSAPYPWNECKPGYTPYGQNCFKVISSQTWNEAQETCQMDGANLASIQSIAENSFATALVSVHPQPSWIGLSADESKQTYGWVDKWPLRFTHWVKENYGGQGRECVAILKNGRWNGTECNQRLPGLCRISTRGPPPTMPDIPGKCPDTTWSRFDLHCYKLIQDELDFSNSFMKCDDNSGSALPSIHSRAENDFVFSALLFTGELESHVWLGLRRKSKDHPWTWYDGTDQTYDNWASTSDASNTDGRDCAAMSPDDGLWSAKKCSDQLPFSCKKLKEFPSPDRNPSTGLSPGQKVGIAFGVIFLVLFIVSGTLFYLHSTQRVNVKYQWERFTDKIAGKGFNDQHSFANGPDSTA